MLTIEILRLMAANDGARSERGAGVVEYLGLAALGIAIVAALLLGMEGVTETLIGRIGEMVTGG